METRELHRRRLIDHIQLVVRDLSAARRFYSAILESLNISIGGTGDGYLWADGLFVSTPDSKAARRINRTPSPGIPGAEPAHGGLAPQGCHG